MTNDDLHAQRGDVNLLTQVLKSSTQPPHPLWFVEHQLTLKIDHQSHQVIARDSSSLVLVFQIKHGENSPHADRKFVGVGAIPTQHVGITDVNHHKGPDWAKWKVGCSIRQNVGTGFPRAKSERLKSQRAKSDHTSMVEYHSEGTPHWW